MARAVLHLRRPQMGNLDGDPLRGCRRVGNRDVADGEAWFIAARGGIDPSTDAFPGTGLLRGLIGTSDGFEWLEAQDVVLPEWLTVDDDEDAL